MLFECDTLFTWYLTIRLLDKGVFKKEQNKYGIRKLHSYSSISVINPNMLDSKLNI